MEPLKINHILYNMYKMISAPQDVQRLILFPSEELFAVLQWSDALQLDEFTDKIVRIVKAYSFGD